MKKTFTAAVLLAAMIRILTTYVHPEIPDTAILSDASLMKSCETGAEKNRQLTDIEDLSVIPSDLIKSRECGILPEKSGGDPDEFFNPVEPPAEN